MSITPNSKQKGCGGFSLSDLIALIALCPLLLAATLPSLTKSKSSGLGLVCVNNQRQLMLAWRLYANDYGGWLLSGLPVPSTNRAVWCSGNLDFTANKGNWDPTVNITQSPMFPYAGRDARLWRCPADNARVVQPPSRHLSARVRSMSMNQGFDMGVWLPYPAYKVYQKGSDIVAPSKTWVLMDEHPESINDGSFAVQIMTSAQTIGRFIDGPAWYHEGGAGISFADGHAEIRHWEGGPGTTKWPMKSNLQYTGPQVVKSRDLGGWNDLRWISQNTTVDKNGAAVQ